jgi:hypothetical protein
MTTPCPACGSTGDRKGFCCEGCHAAYMTIQHSRWSRPATGLLRPERIGPGGPWTGMVPSRPGRPDRCWQTDEQVGGWASCVRAYEEIGD